MKIYIIQIAGDVLLCRGAPEWLLVDARDSSVRDHFTCRDRHCCLPYAILRAHLFMQVLQVQCLFIINVGEQISRLCLKRF